MGGLGGGLLVKGGLGGVLVRGGWVVWVMVGRVDGCCVRGIIIFQGVLIKLHFSIKFPHLSKFIDLMKDLKYEHQSIFPCEGGSNLILGTGRENQIFVYQIGTLCKI